MPPCNRSPPPAGQHVSRILGKGRNQAGIYKGEHKTAKRSERIGSNYKAISLILIFSWINSELYQKIAFKWIHGKKQLEFLAFNRVPFFLGKNMRSICILNDTTLKTGVVPFCHSGIFLRLNGFDLSMQIMNKNSAYPLQVNTRYR